MIAPIIFFLVHSSCLGKTSYLKAGFVVAFSFNPVIS